MVFINSPCLLKTITEVLPLANKITLPFLSTAVPTTSSQSIEEGTLPQFLFDSFYSLFLTYTIFS